MRPLKALISKNTLHRAHTGKLKIENPKYTDLLIPGNIVEIESNGKLHHGIVMNTHDYNLKFHKRANTTFVIVTLDKDKLIGLIGLEDINHINRTGTLGIFIGDKEHRSNGYGTEAIRLILDYGFNYMNLNNILLF